MEKSPGNEGMSERVRFWVALVVKAAVGAVASFILKNLFEGMIERFFEKFLEVSEKEESTELRDESAEGEPQEGC
ncbi:hypothetical protein ACFV4I_09675 [Nocardiopsis alba]|uniref:hypothetical protein n=1 Tax=Nocardiopsis alba TaxID=53437 RepID=UPI00364C10C2